MSEKEYTTEDMVNDFVNPAEYVKTTDLCDKGNLIVKDVKDGTSDDYGDAYLVTFEDGNGNALKSFVSAKQPYAVFDQFKGAMVGSTVKFDKSITADKKTILKVRLVSASADLKAML